MKTRSPRPEVPSPRRETAHPASVLILQSTGTLWKSFSCHTTIKTIKFKSPGTLVKTREAISKAITWLSVHIWKLRHSTVTDLTGPWPARQHGERRAEKRPGSEGLSQGHAAPCWCSDSEGSIVSWRAGEGGGSLVPAFWVSSSMDRKEFTALLPTLLSSSDDRRGKQGF